MKSEKKDEKKYTRFIINKSGQTVVIGTKHPNVNLWLVPNVPLKLTDLEVEYADLSKFPKIEEVTDPKLIAKAVRPDEAHRNIVAGVMKQKEDARKKLEKDNTGGFNDKPQEAKRLSGLTVNEINAR
jgi:hypothetical protein